MISPRGKTVNSVYYNHFTHLGIVKIVDFRWGVAVARTAEVRLYRGERFEVILSCDWEERNALAFPYVRNYTVRA